MRSIASALSAGLAGVLLTGMLGCGGSGETIGALGADGGGADTSAGTLQGVDCAKGPNYTGCPCSPGETKHCYTGPASTENVGACHAGTQMCVAQGQESLASIFGSCTGEVVPSATVSCAPTEDAGKIDASTPSGDTGAPGVDASNVTCPVALTQWVPMSTTGAPPSMVAGPPLVWTGKEVMVFSGRDDNDLSVEAGWLYNPATDTWRSMSMTGAPQGRVSYAAIWTGSRVIVWGGEHDALTGGSINSTPLDDGGIYDPVADTWVAIPSPASLGLASGPTAGLRNLAWTGTELVIFGGGATDGWFYKPTTKTFRPFGGGLGLLGPAQLYSAAAWGADAALEWGGTSTSSDQAPVASGSAYTDASGKWTALASSPLSARSRTDSVWTGEDLLIHGGFGGFIPGDGGASLLYLSDGAVYHRATDSWSTLPAGGGERSEGTAVWTGCSMIELGGENGDNTAWSTGMQYTPATKTWTALPTLPERYLGDTNGAVWAGDQLVTFASGGNDVGSMFEYRLTP